MCPQSADQANELYLIKNKLKPDLQSRLYPLRRHFHSLYYQSDCLAKQFLDSNGLHSIFGWRGPQDWRLPQDKETIQTLSKTKDENWEEKQSNHHLLQFLSSKAASAGENFLFSEGGNKFSNLYIVWFTLKPSEVKLELCWAVICLCQSWISLSASLFVCLQDLVIFVHNQRRCKIEPDHCSAADNNNRNCWRQKSKMQNKVMKVRTEALGQVLRSVSAGGSKVFHAKFATKSCHQNNFYLFQLKSKCEPTSVKQPNTFWFLRKLSAAC